MSGNDTDRQLVYESTIEEEFRVHEERYERYGLDMGADLDEWAQKDAKRLEARALVYPKNGSNLEKWKVLRAAAERNETERKVDDVRGQIAGKLSKLHAALDSTDTDAYKRALQESPRFTLTGLEIIELGLDEVLEESPDLILKIRELRSLIGKLRRLV
jgi:hypothetical protein